MATKRKRRASENAATDASPFIINESYRGINNHISVFSFIPTKPPNADVLVISTLLLKPAAFVCLQKLAINEALKVQIRMKITFYKATSPDTTIDSFFSSKAHVILKTTEIEVELSRLLAEIRATIEKFTNRGSGWVVEDVVFIDMFTIRYKPLSGSCHVNLPRALKDHKAVLNIQNQDGECFKYSILAALYPQEQHRYRTAKYKPMLGKLNCEGIESPVKLCDIERFERQNPPLVINVFGYSGKLYPLQLSKCKDKGRTAINLLYVTDKDGQGHFCLITDLSKLLFQATKCKNRKHFCYRCLFRFHTKRELEKHEDICNADNQRIEMPEKTVMKFEQYKCKLPQPLCIYADFESFLVPETGSASKSSIRKTHRHIPNSYALYPILECCDNCEGKYGPLHLYRGPNCVENFLEKLLDIAEEYQLMYDFKQGMTMSLADRERHEAEWTCHICEGEIREHNSGCGCKECGKVRDHCHLCGRYRGPAHSWCNIKYYLGRDVTIFFHNLMKYDGKLIMQEIGRTAKTRGLGITLIPKGIEDYVTFSLTARHERSTKDGVKVVPWRIKFLDSYQFLPSSLAALVDNLKASGGKDRFICVNREIAQDKIELCLQKGVYPYQRVKSWSAFNETSLPDEDGFYDELKQEAIKTEQLEHARSVWQAFSFRTFGQYHNLYLTLDVLLLADVVQSFRLFCRRHYGLDPPHFVTLASFGWCAMLKMTGIELELISDPNMYLLVEAGIRGGVSMISERFAKANNHYMTGYDATQPSKYIIPLDMNNMYGCALSEALPYADFKWEDDLEMDFMSVPDDADRGYIVMCDLNYPEELHLAHNDYPLAPERLTPDELSPYCQRLADMFNYKHHPTEKLVPNLRNKEKYILHYRNLKFYLKQGLKLITVWQVLSFKQKKWMQCYISFNTEQRKKSKTPYEKALFKLLNNSAFGKSIQNVRKYITFRMVTNERKFNRLVSNPLFEAAYTFSEDLVGILLKRNVVVLDQPIYAGFACLELSKLLLYKFHYEFMKVRYGSKAKLLATDTDSGIYCIETKDLYQDMLAYRDVIFDTSSYEKKHFLYSPKSALVPGLMKDEADGNIIAEFAGLRAKMYSIKLAEGKEKKRAKGVTKAITEKKLKHEDYVNALFSDKPPQKHKMQTIKSSMLKIFTVEIDKVTLVAIDDKRWVNDDGIQTMALGHKNIK